MSIDAVDTDPEGCCVAGDERFLLAFYDLKQMPVAFDFAYYLMAAEVVRAEKGLDGIRVVFMPGERRWIANGRLNQVSDDVRAWVNWRFDNILLPLLDLFPTVCTHTLPSNREQAWEWLANARHTFPPRDVLAQNRPDTYTIVYNTVNRRLHRTPGCWRPRSPEPALLAVRDWTRRVAQGRKIVTITLRDWVNADRNSNFEAWMAFADSLDADAFLPVFVPDTASAFDRPAPAMQGRLRFPLASFDLRLRSALYETAYLNLFVNNGANSIAVLNDRCAYLLFKMVTAGASETSIETLRAMGLAIGGDTSYATPYQRLVWRDDDFDVITQEFQAMCAILDARPDVGVQDAPSPAARDGQWGGQWDGQ